MPEPADDDREAIEAALARRRDEEAAVARGGAWWRAGLETALREDWDGDE